MSDAGETDIDKILTEVLMRIRNQPNASTGMAPSSAMFEREIRDRLEFLHEKPEVKETEKKN